MAHGLVDFVVYRRALAEILRGTRAGREAWRLAGQGLRRGGRGRRLVAEGAGNTGGSGGAAARFGRQLTAYCGAGLRIGAEGFGNLVGLGEIDVGRDLGADIVVADDGREDRLDAFYISRLDVAHILDLRRI